MKGIELPINTVVIVLLAVLILIGLVMWFMSVGPPTALQSTLETTMKNCCVKWISLGCGSDIKDTLLCSVPQGVDVCGSGRSTCTLVEIARKINIEGNEEKYCGC